MASTYLLHDIWGAILIALLTERWAITRRKTSGLFAAILPPKSWDEVHWQWHCLYPPILPPSSRPPLRLLRIPLPLRKGRAYRSLELRNVKLNSLKRFLWRRYPAFQGNPISAGAVDVCIRYRYVCWNLWCWEAILSPAARSLSAFSVAFFTIRSRSSAICSAVPISVRACLLVGFPVFLETLKLLHLLGEFYWMEKIFEIVIGVLVVL